MTSGRGSVAARALMSAGIEGSAWRLPTRPLDDESWQSFTAEVSRQRIWGILATAISEGIWPATDDQYDTAANKEEHDAAAMLTLDRQLLHIARTLDEVGICYRLLKGPAHAHTLWKRGTERYYTDLDILVPSNSFREAVALIEERQGARRTNPGEDLDLISDIGKGLTLTLPNGIEVDMHRTIGHGPYRSALAPEALFEAQSLITIGDRQIPVLAPEMMIVHACWHSALGSRARHLVPYRDIAGGCRLSRESDLMPRILATAKRWRCEGLVAHAVRDTHRIFALAPLGPLGLWAWSHTTCHRERLWLATYLTELPVQEYLRVVATLAAFPSWHGKARYLRAELFHEGRDRPSVRIRRVLSSAGSSVAALKDHRHS